jgi:hypothetical protein
MNEEIEILIARHFDGGLSVEQQRQLAEMLSNSNEARQTLARYLRLEGAAIKLAAARQLGLPSEAPTLGTGGTPASHAMGETTAGAPGLPTSRGVRAALMAVAASLLVALLASPLLFRPPVVDAGGELDRLADHWLQIQSTPQFDEPAAWEVENPVASVIATERPAENESDEPELEAESSAPPSWMVAAMADLATERKSDPDKG